MKRLLLIVCKIIDKILNVSVSYIFAKNELKRIIQRSGKLNRPIGLSEWYNKWSELGRPNKDFYRVFSKYIGPEIDIVPDDISHNVIVPILNPKRYISTFADKNMFDKLLAKSGETSMTAVTIIRCIDGVLYDSKYNLLSKEVNINNLLSEETSLIVKPSLDSSSGKSVMFFDKVEDVWIDRNNHEQLNISYLSENLGNNYIFQRVMTQSSFMSKLCKSSVNTIRMAVYRSVEDNCCHVLNTIIRIGKKGSLVDNTHAGGVFVGVNEYGKLGNYCCDQYGVIYERFNDIDFSTNEIVIPEFKKVKEFAEELCNRLPHLRLFALDIMLNENNEPVLIEYNIKAFAPWLFQFTIGPAFGKYTDEIITYCKEHKKEASRIFISF